MTDQLNFQRIGLLYHPKVPQSRVMVAEMLEFVESFGVSAWVGESWNEATVVDKINDTDVLVTLGGDGSMLRAAHMSIGHRAIVLGVNMGTLGFLAEVEPSEWMSRFEQMLTGQYWVEERMMINAEWRRSDISQGSFLSLNDVVVSRGTPARVLRLDAAINGSYLTSYTADGMISATPTGSTAYALAAGGPILPPELKNFLMVPIAPHLSLEQAIVLSVGDRVTLKVSTNDKAMLTIDGQIDQELEAGDQIIISASPLVSRFLRFHDQTYFYKTLMQRLGWPTDS